MQTVSLSDFLTRSDQFETYALQWGTFVYPTDTIYGLWWLVREDIIQKITVIKRRPSSKHYSIIAPSVQRVHDYFDVSSRFQQEWTDARTVHGPLTMILPLKKWVFYSEYPRSLLSQSWRIWVRFIDHWFQNFVTSIGEPWITTSANISWHPSISSLDDLTQSQLGMINYGIDDWRLVWSGSRIIDYVSGEIVR